MPISRVIKTAESIFKGDSIGSKARRGSIFILSSNILRQVLDFTRKIILVRILTPTDFGLVGIAMTVISGVQILSNTGLRAALIQKKDLNKSLLDTAWSIEITRGLILSCIVFFSAPIISNFFKSENSTNILRVLSILPLMDGLRNIGTIYFDKELKFHKILLYQQIIGITVFVTSLLCVLVIKNAWVIVAGSISGVAASVIASYILHKYRPNWRINWNDFKILFDFGKNLLIIGIVTYLLEQGGNFFIGRILGTASLGIYLLAYNTAILPINIFGDLIRRITFPAYAHIQDDLYRLRHAFLKSFKTSMVLLVPVTIGLITLSDNFILIIYGAKWQNAVEPFKILCFFALLRANSFVIAPLLHGIGKPNLATRARIVELAVFSILIYPAIRTYGIIGVALAITITYLIALLLRYYYILKILPSTLKPMTLIILKILINAFGMTIILLSFRNSVYSILSLIGLVLVSAIVYFSAMFLTDKKWLYNLANR
ncbi:oligosaccharide flippase family protein [Candidatus Poribacteria bacterium]|nr:oligosaccharide flippase family protein [Candidatus Poribacteria bacterium]